jgi:hypothetical protein
LPSYTIKVVVKIGNGPLFLQKSPFQELFYHCLNIKIEKNCQVHQTIYHAHGIDPETNYIVEERPFYTTPYGSGKVIVDLLANQARNQTINHSLLKY